MTQANLTLLEHLSNSWIDLAHILYS